MGDLVLSQTHRRPVKPSFSPASTVAPRHASQPIMSYADIAAKGPKQSPEEAPALEPSESESASLIDVDSPHVSSVKSDFQEQEVKTETQAERLEREAEDKARAEAQKASEAAEGAKKKAATKSKEVKDALKKDGQKLSENR